VKKQNISRAHLPPPSPHLCPFDLRPGQTAAAACWTSSGSFADSSESRMFTLTRGSLDYITPWLQHGESAFLFWKKTIVSVGPKMNHYCTVRLFDRLQKTGCLLIWFMTVYLLNVLLILTATFAVFLLAK
jgi:hypothetical protein